MKIYVPEYFNNFKCSADKCKDSCCIGWEIWIDDKTRAKYDMLNTSLGKEIREKSRKTITAKSSRARKITRVIGGQGEKGSPPKGLLK